MRVTLSRRLCPEDGPGVNPAHWRQHAPGTASGSNTQDQGPNRPTRTDTNRHQHPTAEHQTAGKLPNLAHLGNRYPSRARHYRAPRRLSNHHRGGIQHKHTPASTHIHIYTPPHPAPLETITIKQGAGPEEQSKVELVLGLFMQCSSDFVGKVYDACTSKSTPAHGAKRVHRFHSTTTEGGQVSIVSRFSPLVSRVHLLTSACICLHLLALACICRHPVHLGLHKGKKWLRLLFHRSPTSESGQVSLSSLVLSSLVCEFLLTETPSPCEFLLTETPFVLGFCGTETVRSRY